MILRLNRYNKDAELELSDLEFERSCPLCTLGKTPSGAVCSTCNGEGIIVTMLGYHVLAFVAMYLDRFKSGKLNDPIPCETSLEEARRKTKGALVKPAVLPKGKGEEGAPTHPASVPKTAQGFGDVLHASARVPNGSEKLPLVRPKGDRRASSHGPGSFFERD